MKKSLKILLPVLVVSTGLLCGLVLTVRPPHYFSETVVSEPSLADGDEDEEETDLDEDEEGEGDEDGASDTAGDTTAADESAEDEDLDYEEEYEVDSDPDSKPDKKTDYGESSDGGTRTYYRESHVRDNTPATADLNIPAHYILCAAFIFAGFAMIILSNLRVERLRRKKVELESRSLKAHVNFRRSEDL